MGNWVKRW